MNFFEHQDRSRRQTRWLVLLFILAVLAVVFVVDLVLLVGLGFMSPREGVAALSSANLRANGGMLALGAFATGATIGLASLFKTLSLRGGGGEVARQLGGTLVDPDSRDPLRRRLVNVVEEIALAAGVPVPEIYVLDQEAGINAFAAGYSPADAAIAVTRGTLEKLSRSELQGVVAHEFSHILNGDMRLNIRLMGALFGILLLALIGRRVLYHSRYLGRSRDNSGAVILGLALALVAVGYVGLFFGRVIKSAVSRQREYLADASAVQFTRDPGSIGGALKKIAVYGDHSYLKVDTEEVGHMLFGPGQSLNLFATHPPLLDRIARVEPGFREEDLQTLAKRIERSEERERDKAKRERDPAPGARGQGQAGEGRIPFDPRTLVDRIGSPDMQGILVAAALADSLPAAATDLARAVESAPVGLLYSLLGASADVRTLQLQVIGETLGKRVEQAVRHLVDTEGTLDTAQRLPLLEIALPALHRQPVEVLQRLLKAVDTMIRVDGRVDVFEYLMAHLVRQYLWESANPHKVRLAGRKSLRQCSDAVRDVLGVVAWQGAPDRPAEALAAYREAVGSVIGESPESLPPTEDWMGLMDRSLPKLDELTATGKERLLHGISLAIRHDGRYVEAELELLRVVCSALHVPIPALAPQPAD